MTEIGTPDPVIYYTARDGKVYDEEGNEAGTARTANGRDLERHAEALETAKKQRAAMDRADKLAPVLVRPAGSHSLELGHQGDPFSKEELFPILELTAPRVGFIRAQMSADRYKHSSGWSEWRIYLRDVRTPDPERPELAHLGRDAAGIGPATRDAIGRACVPIVEAWLASPAYIESRRRAATHAMRRQIVDGAGRGYNIEHDRKTLERIAGELAGAEYDRLRRVLELLEAASQLLEADPITT